MIDKLLDEPYWAEMESTLNPWIRLAQGRKAFSTFEDDDVLVAYMFTTYVIERSDLKVIMMDFGQASERQLKNITQIIKENIEEFYFLLLEDLRSLTAVEIRQKYSGNMFDSEEFEKEEVESLMKSFAAERNLQVLLLEYKRLCHHAL